MIGGAANQSGRNVIRIAYDELVGNSYQTAFSLKLVAKFGHPAFEIAQMGHELWRPRKIIFVNFVISRCANSSSQKMF
jgi:hypothetical protein